MTIPNNATLRATAKDRLSHAPQIPNITLIYGSCVLGLSVIVFVAQFLLDSQIGKTSGLSNLGTRSMLQTVSQILPVIQMILTMCLNLGYSGVMLRCARRLYVSPNTLRSGFERFGPMLRLHLIRLMIYGLLSIGSFYLSALIYSYSPLSRDLMAALAPLAETMSPEALASSPAVMDALRGAIAPISCITGCLFLIFGLPVIYGYRMAEFWILDKPGMGALFAMRQSKRMMKGRKRALLRVDLGFWWYYLLTAVSVVLAYGDVIADMLGVALPFSETAAYFVFYGAYIVFQLAIICLFRAKVSQVYALIYDSSLPRQESAGGVVLGNIFQM